MILRSINGATCSLRHSINVQKCGPVRFSLLHLSTTSRADRISSLNAYEEVQIPVPWGYVSGKWWGRRDVTPIIGLHGFQDNAGTFDRLAPLLNVPAFLAWDAPGHGKSSHMPSGMVYTFIDFVITLRRIVKLYGWQRVSIIGHSFGSCMGHIYSSLYRTEVDRFVSLDCARTLMAMLGSNGMDGLPLLRKQSDKSLKADRKIGKDPPAYTMEDMVVAFCKGTQDSVHRDHAVHLLERGATAHPTKPNHFYFTRDQKLRNSDFNRPNLELLKESAQNVKCHILTILGTQGFINLAAESDCGNAFFELEDIVKNSAASYGRCNVEGTHHVHLNNPERVAPLINKFFSQ